MSVSENAMYWYNSTKSDWIDYVGRSKKTFDNDYCIVAVHYTNQQGYTNGDLYFWVPVEDYDNLRNAESIGSVYYHWWSKYGLNAYERYIGQDEDDEGNSGQVQDDTIDENFGTSNQNDIPIRVLQDNTIDHQTLYEARMRINDGTYDDWLEEQDYTTSEKRVLNNWINRFEGSLELLEWSNELREAIALQKLTLNKGFKILLRDIEGLFGISFKQKAFYGLMSQIAPQELNPTTWIRYKYKFEQIYQVLEREGIQGAGKIGKRIASAKNPLIRSRAEFRGARTAYRTLKGTQKNWLEGDEAVEAIKRFHSKVVKEEASGIIKRNSLYLEKRVVEQGGKKITQVRWAKSATKGRKIITLSKKALRLARWVVFF